MRQKVITILIVLGIAGACFISTIVEKKLNKVTEPSYTLEEDTISYNSIVFETVAHIPAYKFPEYTLVWSDEELDRAVYIKNDYVPTSVVEVGDTVYLNEKECSVIETDEQGFTFKLPEGSIAVYGLSGTYIYFKNTPIAMVSKATSVDSIYAVYM